MYCNSAGSWQCISSNFKGNERNERMILRRGKILANFFIHPATLIQRCTFCFIYLIYQNILIFDDISLCCIIPSPQKWVIMMVWWWSTVACSKIPISRLGIAMIDREILLCNNKNHWTRQSILGSDGTTQSDYWARKVKIECFSLHIVLDGQTETNRRIDRYCDTLSSCRSQKIWRFCDLVALFHIEMFNFLWLWPACVMITSYKFGLNLKFSFIRRQWNPIKNKAESRAPFGGWHLIKFLQSRHETLSQDSVNCY